MSGPTMSVSRHISILGLRTRSVRNSRSAKQYIIRLGAYSPSNQPSAGVARSEGLPGQNFKILILFNHFFSTLIIINIL